MSNLVDQAEPWKLGERALVAARWLLGAAFIYLGTAKALDPVEFLKQVQAYGLIPLPLVLNLTAAVLPWLEIVCGLFLLTGVALRGAGLVVLTLLLIFTSAILVRGLNLAGQEQRALCVVKFDCGCGGGEVYVCNKLAENTLLIGLAALPIAWPRQRLSLLPPPPRA